MPYPPLPDHVTRDIRRARRLEWWSIGMLVSIIVVMYLAMGSSQAMKSAWIEDLLSLVPATLFLLASWLEGRPPTEKYPYGFHRVGSLAFFAAACALTAMGVFLIVEAVSTLVRAEHPTIGGVSLFGHEIWLGWLMIAALVYSVVPMLILGRRKRPIARRIRDKVLYTDADMNAADWQTGLAGIAGVAGIGLGLWWADAAAALAISVSILWDGLKNLRISVAELLDGAPREIDSAAISEEAKTIEAALRERFGDHPVQIRETGRFMRAVVSRRLPPGLRDRSAVLLTADRSWPLIEASLSIEFIEDAADSGLAAPQSRS